MKEHSVAGQSSQQQKPSRQKMPAELLFKLQDLQHAGEVRPHHLLTEVDIQNLTQYTPKNPIKNCTERKQGAVRRM